MLLYKKLLVEKTGMACFKKSSESMLKTKKGITGTKKVSEVKVKKTGNIGRGVTENQGKQGAT